jgi:hypothetical protein
LATARVEVERDGTGERKAVLSISTRHGERWKAGSASLLATTRLRR